MQMELDWYEKMCFSKVKGSVQIAQTHFLGKLTLEVHIPFMCF